MSDVGANCVNISRLAILVLNLSGLAERRDGDDTLVNISMLSDVVGANYDGFVIASVKQKNSVQIGEGRYLLYYLESI